MIIAKDGTTIIQTGNSIICSNGERYMLTGQTLVGPRGPVGINISRMEEALGVVIGLHGGKRF